MSPFRPWYCEYVVATDGSIRLRLAWQDFPSQSVVHDHIFQGLSDVPAWVRQMLLDAMDRGGARTGRFDFPTGWPPVEPDQLKDLDALAVPVPAGGPRILRRRRPS